MPYDNKLTAPLTAEQRALLKKARASFAWSAFSGAKDAMNDLAEATLAQLRADGRVITGWIMIWGAMMLELQKAAPGPRHWEERRRDFLGPARQAAKRAYRAHRVELREEQLRSTGSPASQGVH